MDAFLYGILLQWKLDLRNKSILLTYYVVPLVFFGFMGGVFTSITPDTKSTLIQSMSIFSITMGAILGAPAPISETYGGEQKKSYKIGGIPMCIPLINNLISAFVHLFIMSIIIYFIAPVAFHASLPKNTTMYFVIISIFIIASLSIAAILGLTIKTTSKLTMVSQFIFLPSLMLSGIMFPVKMLPKSLETFGKVLPATLGFEMIKESSMSFKLLLPLLIIIIICGCTSAWRIRKLGID
ncbi:ABC transporter permease [Microbacteriaceae bacterium 4G12]